ncbi:hypothetical protein, partial [Klebsiella pneumoniae]|uniref:hypothetical protein n=1 Tax=Klebsiella pneumoniae TaxID=573 RepID=UPI001C6F9D4B
KQILLTYGYIESWGLVNYGENRECQLICSHMSHPAGIRLLDDPINCYCQPMNQTEFFII